MDITLFLLGATIIVSLTAFNNSNLMSKLIFNPYAVKKFGQWYRLVTSGFIHANFFHLLINMLVLYSFGRAVEMYYTEVFRNAAPYMFLAMYLTSIVAANIPTLLKYQEHSYYNSLGASGAVSAVVFASILFNPYGKIYFYGIIGLPGILMGVAYLIYSYYMSKKGGSADNINHDAHFYGALYGMLFTVVFKPKLVLYFFSMLIQF